MFPQETVSRETCTFAQNSNMPRKRWTKQIDVTPSLLKVREKRKWQIALRRYVLDRNISTFYAPYFGLDIDNLRKWFEMQFDEDTGWEHFGEKWQFDHIVPVTFFDFSNEEDLRLCWNFTNIRIERCKTNKDRSNRLDVLGARAYFQQLYDTTLYPVCKRMLDKIDSLELSAFANTAKQQAFIIRHREYLDMIENYSAFEFGLLNSGRAHEDVKREIEFFKNMGENR
jgi:hypothetical protein